MENAEAKSAPTRKELQSFNEVIGLKSEFKNGANTFRNPFYPHIAASKHNQPAYFFNSSFHKPNDLLKDRLSVGNRRFSSSPTDPPVSPLNLSLPYMRSPPALLPSKVFPTMPSNYGVEAYNDHSSKDLGRNSSVRTSVSPISDVINSSSSRRRFMSTTDEEQPSKIPRIQIREHRPSSDSSFENLSKSPLSQSRSIPSSPLYNMWQQRPFSLNRFSLGCNLKQDYKSKGNDGNDRSLAPNMLNTFPFVSLNPSDEAKGLWNPNFSLGKKEASAKLSPQPHLLAGKYPPTSAESFAILQRSYPLFFLPAALKQLSSQYSFQAMTSSKLSLPNQSAAADFKNQYSSSSTSKDLSSFSVTTVSKPRPISSSSYDSGCAEAECDGRDEWRVEEHKEVRAIKILKTVLNCFRITFL